MKRAVKLSVKGFKNAWYCRGVARALVFFMVIHGSPFQDLSQTYQWDPKRLHAVFTKAIDWWRHGLWSLGTLRLLRLYIRYSIMPRLTGRC